MPGRSSTSSPRAPRRASSAPAALLLCLLAAAARSAAAEEGPYCRIAEPEVTSEGMSLAIAVTVECSRTPAEGLLRYPAEGPYYLGASLVQRPGREGEEISVSFFEEESDLPFVTLEQLEGTATARLRLEQRPIGTTHFMVALWTQLMDCVYCSGEQGLGPVDQDLFPMPLDSYPRPRCDIEALSAIGYFDWTEDGDPSGFLAPDAVHAVLGQTDCFRFDPGMPGLGVSLKSWRVAPLPEN